MERSEAYDHPGQKGDTLQVARPSIVFLDFPTAEPSHRCGGGVLSLLAGCGGVFLGFVVLEGEKAESGLSRVFGGARRLRQDHVDKFTLYKRRTVYPMDRLVTPGYTPTPLPI